MLCMAPSTTNNIIGGLVNDFDGDVVSWSNQILKVKKIDIYGKPNVTLYFRILRFLQ